MISENKHDEHVFKKYKLLQRTHKLWDIVAKCEICKANIERREAELMLNEHAALKKENEGLRKWARWIMHLHHNIGKNGGPVSDDEWKECLEAYDSLMGGA